MSDADDKLDFCKQALGEIGTRSTITSLDPLDGSPEAFYCNLFFNSTRDQVLRAAHWNFAGVTDIGVLWKAASGTPENPVAANRWSPRDPAPPWLYSFLYPGEQGAPESGCVAVRRIRAQPSSLGGDASDVPFYGGASFGSLAEQGVSIRFEVATDQFDQAGNLIAFTLRVLAAPTIVTPGSGYQAGDYITITGGGSIAGSPATLLVIRADDGIVQGVSTIGSGGSYTTAATTTMTQLSTTGNGTGFTCDPTFGPQHSSMKVILCNAPNIVIDLTTSIVAVADYDPSFSDAFGLALQGKLVLALIGDKQLATGKLQQANAAIIDARVRDGNEGLMVYDHVPDWLQVRGVSSMTPIVPFNPPYGPLFGV